MKLTTQRCNGMAVLFALALIGPCQLRAQAAPNRVLTTDTDSSAWQRVLMHVVSALSTQLVRAAADTSAQPWLLRLPAGEPQRRFLEAQLRTILRARAALPGDSVVHTLEMGPLTIVGDTARVKVSVNETRRCPGTTRTTGSGWVETVLVPRHPQLRFWGAAFSGSSLVGDRVSC